MNVNDAVAEKTLICLRIDEGTLTKLQGLHAVDLLIDEIVSGFDKKAKEWVLPELIVLRQKLQTVSLVTVG